MAGGFFSIAIPSLRRVGTYPSVTPPAPDAGNQLRRFLVTQILLDEERDRLKAAAKAEKQAKKLTARARVAAKREIRPTGGYLPRAEANPPPSAAALLARSRALRSGVAATVRARDMLAGVNINGLPTLPTINFVRRNNPELAEDIRPLLVDLIEAVDKRRRRQQEEEELFLALAMEVLQ